MFLMGQANYKKEETHYFKKPKSSKNLKNPIKIYNSQQTWPQ